MSICTWDRTKPNPLFPLIHPGRPRKGGRTPLAIGAAEASPSEAGGGATRQDGAEDRERRVAMMSSKPLNNNKATKRIGGLLSQLSRRDIFTERKVGVYSDNSSDQDESSSHG